MKVLGDILFVTSLFLLTFTSRFVFAPLMPTIELETGLNHSQAGSFFMMMSVGLFCASIISGFISSRLKHKGALFISITSVALIMFTFYFTTSLWSIRLLMLLLGVAAGLHLPSAIATITAMVNRNDWGKALALHQTAPPLSLILGPLLTVALLHYYSWRAILLFIGCAALLLAFIFNRLCNCGNFPGEAPRPAVVKEVVFSRSFWIMIILFSLGIGGSAGIYSMMPLYLVTERGLNNSWANTIVGLSQVSGLFMAFAAGWITDRIGEKRAISFVLFFAGIATILLGKLYGQWLMIIIFIQPALIVCFFPAGFSAFSHIAQSNLRSVAASFGPPTAFVLGGGLFPSFLGYMGQNHTFSLGIILTGCAMILGALLPASLRLIKIVDDGC